MSKAVPLSRVAPEMSIGLFGFGVVGSAVFQLLRDNATRLSAQHGFTPVIRRVVVRHPHKPRPVAVPADLLTTDAAAVLDDPRIAVVVEVIGGVDPAKALVLTALRRGKSVVTANKELMADHGQELLQAAAEHGVDLYYEASVGGGIPVLRPLRETLSAGRLDGVLGIINGTTNYILDRMTQGGQSFAAALAEAQARGYAEPDPTADVEGLDAARKLTILAGLAFHTQVPASSVAAAGIIRIAPEDIAYGRERDWVVKLIASAERHGDGVTAWVGPAFLSRRHPLAGVGDAFNAIFVHGAEIGDCMFYGRGAGGLPTASAVIGDILTVAAHRRRGYHDSHRWARRTLTVHPAAAAPARYYLRLLPAAGGSPGGQEPAGGVLATATVGGWRTGAAIAARPAPEVAVAAALAATGVPVDAAVAGTGCVAVETGPVAWVTVAGALERLAGTAVLGSAIRLLI